jgi:hypothetical protein
VEPPRLPDLEAWQSSGEIRQSATRFVQTNMYTFYVCILFTLKCNVSFIAVASLIKRHYPPAANANNKTNDTYSNDSNNANTKHSSFLSLGHRPSPLRPRPVLVDIIQLWWPPEAVVSLWGHFCAPKTTRRCRSALFANLGTN